MMMGRKAGLKYVSRGDPSAYDFLSASFTKDGSGHSLDVSSIVPVNAVIVNARIRLKAAEAGKVAVFRKYGLSNWINASVASTHVANQTIYTSLNPIPMTQDLKIDYNIASATWSECDFVILGWWI